MKTVRIGFSDIPYWVDKENNFITRALRKRYDVQVCDDPDFLIYGAFGTEHLSFQGVKIFYSGEDLSPDFNLCDYAISFDDLQFGDRYLRYPIFAIRHTFAAAKQKHLFTEDDIAAKTGFCNFVYSNGWMASPARKQFFEMLSQYKRVDSGGRYLNNIGGPIGGSIDDKIAFQSKYKFTIAFENGKADSYTTEKLTEAFAAKTIPIYWGNPNVTKDFNEKAFINCNNYASFEEVIERVKEIDNDDALYRAMLSEPIFTPENRPERFDEQRLEEFLYPIFDQPIEKARRRAHHTWRDEYIKDVQKTYAFYNKMTKNPVARLLKKMYSFCIKVWQKMYAVCKNIITKIKK